MKFLSINILSLLLCCAVQATTVTDNFNRPDTAFATNNEQVAVSIGPNWMPARTDDPNGSNTQYRILNNEVAIGVISPTMLQKAMLINTAAGTYNAGTGIDFTISADMKQNTVAQSAYIGLVFNYQDAGNYYLLRLSGIGSVQMLAYSNSVQQAVPINKIVFTPVQNRVYTFSVHSANPYVFDLSIIDTVTSNAVYSTNNFTLGSAVVKHQDGLGGMYTTGAAGTFDNFKLETTKVLRDFGLFFRSN